MANQQLLDHIKQQLQQGVNNERIKQSLIANGWQNTDIEEAFNLISNSTTINGKVVDNPLQEATNNGVCVISGY